MGKLDKDKQLSIIRMYENGMTLRQVAKVFGVSHVAVHKILRKWGIDTRKGGRIIHREVICTHCGVVFKMVRSKWRLRKKVGTFFCGAGCSSAYVSAGADDYTVSSYSQRAGKRQVSSVSGIECSADSVVYFVDGDYLNRTPQNLILFASDSDHMKWHRGDLGEAVILWPVPLPINHLAYGRI